MLGGHVSTESAFGTQDADEKDKTRDKSCNTTLHRATKLQACFRAISSPLRTFRGATRSLQSTTTTTTNATRDGVVKTFEVENGKLVASFSEHKGWVTDFLFWSDTKLMLSAANDGELLAWGIAGAVSDRVKIGIPVFCLALLHRRRQLLCGVDGAIRVYALDEDRESGHVINSRILYQAREHTDIVRCIVCLDSKIFSGGYDHKLVIYDCSMKKKRLDVMFNHKVHSAGITCLSIASDIETIWVLTGSFDKSLKIWTLDGSLLQTLDNFPGTVTGVIYVPRNRVVWVAAATPYAWLYEPKSGDKVSDFIGTFQNVEDEKYHLQILKYFPEMSQAVASTNRRQLIAWKYNTAGCMTAHKCTSPIESLCYTSKVPILIFTGDHKGIISKWECNQSNHFMYNKEDFIKGDVQKMKIVGGRLEDRVKSETKSAPILPTKTAKPRDSPYAYEKHAMNSLSQHDHPNTSILRIFFIESLDYIVAASEDGNIYVWGFDYKAVEVLKSMRPVGMDDHLKKYAVLLDRDSLLLDPNCNLGEDSVTNRVAGFCIRLVLSNHMGYVTSLVTVNRSFKWPSTFLLSGGWDRRICLWDLEEGSLKTVYRNSNPPPNATAQSLEIACEGIINDMAFSPKNCEFACASSDKMVYIRKFNLVGTRMHVVHTLKGHDAEVTAVEWNNTNNKWITGSEDGTVRIWNGMGINDCEHVLNVTKAVTCLCVDQFLGCVVVGVYNDIRVYEPENYRLAQSNLGHMDSVRSIMHVPERHQYVSCSWDCTVRVWNAWRPQRNKRLGAAAAAAAATEKEKEKEKDNRPHVKKLMSQGLKGVSRRVHMAVSFNKAGVAYKEDPSSSRLPPSTAEEAEDDQEQQ